jgi:cysteine sulfinate desulfinase/cysteine desulfurase-like protein
LLTIAGHKLYAPKGIGVLFVRSGVTLPPVVVGAGQERGLRPGTENVAFIVGLGAACALAARVLDGSAKRMAEMSATLLELLRRDVAGLELAGDAAQRLPNTLNVLFPGVSGRKVLEACPRVLASTGSDLSRRQRGPLRDPGRARALPRQGAGRGAAFTRTLDNRRGHRAGCVRAGRRLAAGARRQVKASAVDRRSRP